MINNVQAWWNTDWSDKTIISIVESSGNTLTNFQVPISINTTELYSQAKLNANCSDLRFINITDNTTLNYWLEHDDCIIDDNSTNSIIYVNTTHIPASSFVVIEMYYGNPIADEYSNFTKTMQKTFETDNNTIISFGMNEGIGTTLKNLAIVPNTDNGTLFGSTWNTTHSPGYKANSSVTFDNDSTVTFNGTSSSYVIDNTALDTVTRNATIQGWIYINTVETGENIYWSRYNNDHRVFLIKILNTETISFYWCRETGCGAGNTKQLFGSLGSFGDQTPYTQRWMLFTAIQNASGTYLFINDTLDNSTTTLADGFPVASSRFNIAHAYWIGDSKDFGNATYGSFRYLNRSVTPAEITANFERRKYIHPEPIYYIGDDIIIESPKNITYYNINSIDLNVINSTFIADVWRYSLNNESNVTFTPDTTLNLMLLGSNTLIVYANSTDGDNYSNTVTFTVETACGSSYVGNTTCAGRNINYVAVCKQLGKTIFQWDFDNLTFCQYGCFNGQCLNPIKTCMDRCKDNQTTCSGDYILQCINQTDGCFDWTTDNKTFCELGCIDGLCIEAISLCNYGDEKCKNDNVIYCDDDNGDGFYEWSEFNFSVCRYGCVETFNETTGKINATCNVHSFNYPYDVRNVLTYFGRAINYIFPSFILKIVFIMFMMLLVGGLLGIVSGSWIGGLAGFIFVGFIGLIVWIPAMIYVFVLIAIIGGAILLFASR